MFFARSSSSERIYCFSFPFRFRNFIFFIRFRFNRSKMWNVMSCILMIFSYFLLPFYKYKCFIFVVKSKPHLSTCVDVVLAINCIKIIYNFISLSFIFFALSLFLSLKVRFFISLLIFVPAANWNATHCKINYLKKTFRIFWMQKLSFWTWEHSNLSQIPIEK